MENDREKAKEVNTYKVKYGNKSVKVTQEISRSIRDNVQCHVDIA